MFGVIAGGYARSRSTLETGLSMRMQDARNGGNGRSRFLKTNPRFAGRGA